MFANIKRVSTKTANALDLIIDFATLGEYGLEYPEPALPAPESSCAGRQRVPVPRLTNSRVPVSPLPDISATGSVASLTSRPRRRTDTECPAGNPDFASALRRPRIDLSFSE
jgi:hypothetical protein